MYEILSHYLRVNPDPRIQMPTHLALALSEGQ